MAAIRTAKQFRPLAHRVLDQLEHRRLWSHLGNMTSGLHWQGLMCLAVETATNPGDLAAAAWEQFSEDLGLWTVPRVWQGKSFIDRPIVMTEAARQTICNLRLRADPVNPRVFHPLPPSAKLLSYCFGRAAKEARVVDFCMRDLELMGVAKRVASSPAASIDQIAWALGWRHGKAPRFYRAYWKL